MVRTFTINEVYNLLSEIPDPEIPVLNIREIGMLKEVLETDDGYEVIITPTYTACPAMGMIEDEVKRVMKENNVGPTKVRLVYEPAWSTAWMTAEAKEKLKGYGIAPPTANLFCGKLATRTPREEIQCPRCSSSNTELISLFGSTACKALYKCTACHEPFEYFKCH